MQQFSFTQKLGAEFVGTLVLLATVVGSGIMADNLAAGNTAVALLGNTIPTGAILVLLITLFGPISGAHFNPAVTLVFWLRKEITVPNSIGFVITQIVGGIIGVWFAHAMFELPIIQSSTTVRAGFAQGFSEVIATLGLIIAILGTLRFKPEFVPMSVGLYITAAYWFTASTSFANPAVTIARGFSDTFAGIAPANVPLFIAAQIVGAVLAYLYARWQFGSSDT